MHRVGCYALVASYLVIQLFGQAIHAWSGCEHAHLPGHSHRHVVAHDHGHDHHHHGHDHHHEQAETVSHDVAGWHSGDHMHAIAVDGCLLCQHLALGQIAPTQLDATIDRVAVDQVFPRSSGLVTAKWLGPNSPRAPPVA
ncbi:hypothetical protein ACYFX5_16015 [Bremerella sp. T1]|uniref:hypothetical protein n=1 Tax=Bremerella sp. TYQ1 TaxID=3119568 RepID=UPI001CCD64B2|nr:hypothetical protein [Bremerella volcania]UBM34563.1 hypothetical protein LA756_17965 [Bremerella volcania]